MCNAAYLITALKKNNYSVNEGTLEKVIGDPELMKWYILPQNNV